MPWPSTVTKVTKGLRATSASSRARSVSTKARGVYIGALRAAAGLLHHPCAQVGIAAARGWREFIERETALQRVVRVESVERDEVRVHQHRPGRVLAVVDQRVAVAVEYLGGSRLAHPQSRPDDGAAQRRQPPLLGNVRYGGLAHATASDSSHSSPARTSATTITVSATRAGVARPVNCGSRTCR